MHGEELSFSEILRHDILTDFYAISGLEISDGWEKESGVFLSEALFENDSESNVLGDVGTSGNAKTIAAYSLSSRFGVTVLDYFAVSQGYRKSGIGSFLLNRIKEKCRERSIDRIYLTAKAGEFFAKNGAKELSKGEPYYRELLGECVECEQRGKDCFPRVMVLIL